MNKIHQIHKYKIDASSSICCYFQFFNTNAQINLGEKVLETLQKRYAEFTFTDEDAVKLSKKAVDKMDK